MALDSTPASANTYIPGLAMHNPQGAALAELMLQGCVLSRDSKNGGRKKEDAMGLVKEFKQFAMRGNVLDMAVGIIIGAAFGKIVSSLVADIIMPPIGKLMGNVDFSNLSIRMGSAPEGKVIESLADAKAAGLATINYGVFISTVIDFAIVAFAIFLLVKGVNSMKRKEKEAPPAPPAPPAPSPEEKLLSEIRDLLKQKAG